MGLGLYLTDDEADAIGHTDHCTSDVCAALALAAAQEALARRTAATGPIHLTCCGHVAPEHYLTCEHHSDHVVARADTDDFRAPRATAGHVHDSTCSRGCFR